MPKFNFKKENIPFTQVANSVLNDKNLSAKAKGLYAYLYSKPEGWDFAIDRIANDFTDGRKAVNNGLQELEAQGYLLRERQPTGRVIYLLKSQMSQMDIGQITQQELPNPNALFGKVPKRQSAETDTVSNKDTKVIKNSTLVAEVIKAMETVDPKNKTYYGNTTQRKAADFLVTEYGLEEVLKRISILPQSNKQPYWPTITTPCQLRDKWVALEDAAARAKQKTGAAANVAF